jgi:hypothetical protein
VLLDGAGLGDPELDGLASFNRVGASMNVDAGAVFRAVGNAAKDFSDTVRESTRSESAGSEKRVP